MKEEDKQNETSLNKSESSKYLLESIFINPKKIVSSKTARLNEAKIVYKMKQVINFKDKSFKLFKSKFFFEKIKLTHSFSYQGNLKLSQYWFELKQNLYILIILHIIIVNMKFWIT